MSIVTATIRERPILFSDAMVRAILDGKKTQTRRVVMGKWLPLVDQVMRINGFWTFTTLEYDLTTPYGQPGDRLWVREAFTADIEVPGEECAWYHEALKSFRTWRAASYIYYRADGAIVHAGRHDGPWAPHTPWQQRLSTWEPTTEELEGRRWIPSIFMPRWASRITLEITGIRVERLQDITDDAARAEGIRARGYMNHFSGVSNRPWNHARDAFRELWDSINGARGYGWDVNPWVFVIEFKQVPA